MGPRDRCGRRGPTPRTTGTPTGRASRARRTRRGDASPRCGRCGAPAGAGFAGSPSSHGHAVRVDLLAPDQPAHSTGGGRACARCRGRRRDGRVELVGVRLRACMTSSNAAPGRVGAARVAGAGPGGGVGAASPPDRRPDGEVVPPRRLRAPLPGLTVAAPSTTWSLIPSLGYGVIGGLRTGAPCWSRCRRRRPVASSRRRPGAASRR